jgi:hypothetical protein
VDNRSSGLLVASGEMSVHAHAGAKGGVACSELLVYVKRFQEAFLRCCARCRVILH